jgi:hypothetical protein
MVQVACKVNSGFPEDPVRVRTGSDVGISNACVATAGGIQVFYRDESQGILLGATKAKGASKWSYELVDGDRKTEGRTRQAMLHSISRRSLMERKLMLSDDSGSDY